MTNLKYITLKMLEDKDACEGQVNLFQKMFGDSLELKSQEHAVKLAVKLVNKFDFIWASENLLSGPAWEAYEDIEKPAWEAYKVECGKAFAIAFWNDKP